jgi:hypothetical protein
MAVFYDNNFIRVIDNAVSSELCEQIIAEFKRDHTLHHHDGDRYIELETYDQRGQGKWNPKLEARARRWNPLTDSIAQTVVEMTTDYRARWDPYLMTPQVWSMEGIRVKSYEPNVHEFRLHVDQGNRDSACRFIACLIYLNNNEAGTEFPQEQFTVSAEQGRMVLFPPNWQFPHRGLMPTIDTKYILSTYLHFKD